MEKKISQTKRERERERERDRDREREIFCSRREASQFVQYILAEERVIPFKQDNKARRITNHL